MTYLLLYRTKTIDYKITLKVNDDEQVNVNAPRHSLEQNVLSNVSTNNFVHRYFVLRKFFSHRLISFTYLANKESRMINMKTKWTKIYSKYHK